MTISAHFRFVTARCFAAQLLILLLLTSPLSAALPNLIQWEVRTGGSDSNGGGFVSGASGTDRSQQDAAFCTSADLATTGTAATSVLCPFSAASVGNIIQITAGGCTAGFYQVVSVAVVTATLDRSAGTSTLCTFALGGGLLTPGKPIAQFTGTFGPTVWMKAGTYTITASLDLTTATTVQGLTYQGYSSTHGDTGTATITTATNSTKLFTFQTAGNLASTTLRNLTLSNTAGTPDDCITAPTGGAAGSLLVDNAVLSGCVVGIRGDFSGDFYWNQLFISRTEIKNCTSHGVSHVGNTLVVGSWSHGNGGVGFGLGVSGGDNSQTSIMTVVNSVSSGNTYGVRFGAIAFGSGNFHTVAVINSDLYNNSNDGLNYNVSRSAVFATGNIFDSNTTFGFSAADTPGSLQNMDNAYRNNGTNRSNITAGTGDVTGALTVIPFVNAGAGNFALNSTAGGGTVLKGVGYPGVTPAGTGFQDIGALQSQAAATGANAAYAQ